MTPVIMSTKKLVFGLFISIFVVSSLLTTWHLDFDRLGSIPFGDRALTYSIFFNHSLNIDKYWESAGSDFAWYNGHYFSGYPPLVPLVTVPFLASEQVIAFLWVHLIGSFNGHLAWALESWFLSMPQGLALGLTSVLVFNLLRRLGASIKASYLSSWFFPFTSFALVYATGTNNDLPAAFLVFLGFFLIATTDQFSAKRLILAGLATSLATTAEYPAFLFTFLWGLFALIKLRTKIVPVALLYAIGAAVPLLLLAAYHTYAFGAPWHFAHNYHAYKVNYDQTAANKLDFSLFNIPGGLGFLLFSPLKGLLLYTPLAIFSLLGVKSLISKNRLLSIFTLLGIGGIILFYSSWWDYSGGFDFGPRYLISTLPLIFVLVGLALPRIVRHPVLKWSFLFLTVWGFVTTLIFSFTGIRETIKFENWIQWGALGRFESFSKVIINNNPAFVSPLIIKFGAEWPVLGGLPYSVLSFMLFGAVVLVAITPLLLLKNRHE